MGAQAQPWEQSYRSPCRPYIAVLIAQRIQPDLGLVRSSAEKPSAHRRGTHYRPGRQCPAALRDPSALRRLSFACPLRRAPRSLDGTVVASGSPMRRAGRCGFVCRRMIVAGAQCAVRGTGSRRACAAAGANRFGKLPAGTKARCAAPAGRRNPLARARDGRNARSTAGMRPRRGADRPGSASQRACEP
jgi:hypothetical protein